MPFHLLFLKLGQCASHGSLTAWAADTYLITHIITFKTAALYRSIPASSGMFSVGLLRLSNVLISLFFLFVVVKLVQFVIDQLRGSRLPRLKGPSNNSPLFGRLRDLLASNDRGVVYQSWAEEYGAVYQIPAQLGERRIIICDPKAIAHFHSKDTFTYHALPFSKKFVKKFVSRYI